MILGSCAMQQEEKIYLDPKDKWEECEPWLYHDGEAWTNCMMMA